MSKYLPRTHPHRYCGVLAPDSPLRRSLAHYLWAVLIARIYRVFPLLPHGPPLWEDDCGTQMGEGVHIKPDWDLACKPAPVLMSISASIGDGLRRRF